MLVDVCLFIFFNNTRASSQRLNFITIIIIIDNNIHEPGSKTRKISTRKRNVVWLVLAKVRYTSKVIRRGTLSLWRKTTKIDFIQPIIFTTQYSLSTYPITRKIRLFFRFSDRGTRRHQNKMSYDC